MFLKKIKIFYFFLLQINTFLVFLYHFDVLMSKKNLKKEVKEIILMYF
jgi:hypothetical protein